MNLTDGVGTNPNGYRLPINTVGDQVMLEAGFEVSGAWCFPVGEMVLGTFANAVIQKGSQQELGIRLQAWSKEWEVLQTLLRNFGI